MIQNNPRIQSAVQDLKRRGLSVSDAINQSLQDSAVLEAIRSSYGWASSAALRATQPIRDTPVYKALATSFEEAFDDDSGIGSRYGGYEEKEARRLKREKRAAKAGKTRAKRTEENPESVHVIFPIIRTRLLIVAQSWRSFGPVRQAGSSIRIPLCIHHQLARIPALARDVPRVGIAIHLGFAHSDQYRRRVV